MQDCSQRCRCSVELPASPAIEQLLRSPDLVELAPSLKCCAPQRCQARFPKICGNEPLLLSPAPFSGAPLRDYHEPDRFQVEDLWRPVIWKWPRSVVLCPGK